MSFPDTIINTKDLRPTNVATPLLLAQFQFPDGTLLYASTHPLNNAEGGFGYLGQNYFARIDSQDIQAMQARSSAGIDRVPTVTIHLHDSDKEIWNSCEVAADRGFRGTILTLVFVYWEVGTSSFSTDAWTPFIGICDSPRFERQNRADMLVITATASRNTQRITLPAWHVQQTCGNTFPTTAAERLSGATDMSSQQWGCGYDPDQAGTDPEIGGDCRRGNGAFTTCGYIKTDCIARGMYSTDSSSRPTGRFTGIQFAPTNRTNTGKSYLLGKTVISLEGRNDAIYKQFIPMLYGTQWVSPPIIANDLSFPNITFHEVVICQDNIGPNAIIQVVVNGVIVPQAGTGGPDDSSLTWAWVSFGSRNGSAYGGVPLNSQGDPYGSQACIITKVYAQVDASGSTPNIMVLASGPKIKTPNTANVADQATWPYVQSSNPAWVLLDCLIWGNFQYSDFDLQSFINESAYCDVTVGYTDLNGNSATHARFKASFALLQARPAGDVIAAVLRCFNAQLVRNSQTGLTRLLIRKTLADQQPSPISGSNYNTGISSVHANGSGGTGYIAWLFDETTMYRDDPDQPPILPVISDASAQVPTTVSVGFQDEDNTYADDSCTVRDSDAIARNGGYQGSVEIQEQMNVLGLTNFDQSVRIINTYLAERNRGNENGDTRGTRQFPIQGNSRIAHLQVGHICAITWEPLGLSMQLARVTSIQPSTNFQRSNVTLSWHEDEWYTDVFGQQGPANRSNPQSGRPNRAPYAWQPFGEQPITGDSVYGSPAGYAAGSWWNFGIVPTYVSQSNGVQLVQVFVYGCPPVNQLSPVGSGGTQPPLIAVQGATASTGGTIPGGINIYLAVSAIDTNGLLSAMSGPTLIRIPSGTNTNTATTPHINWAGGTVGYVLYGGTDSNNMSEQARAASSTPSTITITALNYETFGPPDTLANSLTFQGKLVIHGGVFGDACTSVSLNTIGLTPPGVFGVNQWAGYDIEKVANAYGVSSEVPIAHFRVSANDAAGNLTVSPDPVAAGVAVDDVFIMLMKPDIITATTIGDSNLVNAYAPAGLTPHVETGQIRMMANTNKGQVLTISDNDATSWTITHAWNVTPDSTTRFIIEEAGWPYTIDTEIITATDPTPSPAPLVAKLNVNNWAGETILIQASIQDAAGNLSLGFFGPTRVLYIWGTQGTRVLDDVDATMLPTDGTVLIQNATADHTYTCLPFSQVPNQQFYISRRNCGGFTITIQAVGMDTFQGGGNFILLTDDTVNYMSNFKVPAA